MLKDNLSYDGCFLPTKTTDLVLEVAKKKNFGDVLDLGCGSGIIGIELKLNNPSINLHLSDVSVSAIKTAKENISKLGLQAKVYQSNIFDSWVGKKFDLIVNDVSGVTEEIAKETPWFKNVPCQTGSSGLKLTELVIKESSLYLKEKGCLIFPFISLSSKQAIKNILAQYTYHKLLLSKEWPLPPELLGMKKRLFELREQGLVDFKEKYGLLVGYTEVYSLSPV